MHPRLHCENNFQLTLASVEAPVPSEGYDPNEGLGVRRPSNPKRLIVIINIAQDGVAKPLCPKDNNGFRDGA